LPPPERLYFDLEIEFEALTTAEEVTSNAVANQIGGGIADALFHELKLKFVDQDIHVGPPQGSFRRGSLVGVVLQSLSAGVGTVVTMITVIETPGLLRALLETILKSRFDRDVVLSRFRHRLSVRRGWADADMSTGQAPLTVRWFRSRPLQMLATFAAVFVLASLVTLYFAQQEDAKMLAISSALARIEDKLDRIQSDSSATQVDGEENESSPPTAEGAGPSAVQASRRDRPTEVCRRVSQEDASYVILRCR